MSQTMTPTTSHSIGQQMDGPVDHALFSGVILRHATRELPGAGGLSALQHAMLTEPHPVRIFSAPTGSGMCCAFKRAVMDEASPARVLFVVPTRRLADNLARSLCEAMRADARYDDAEIQRRVMIWTSRERERQEAADPGINVRRLRLRQVRGWDAPERGTMTIATPESIAWALLHPRTMAPGTPPLSIVDYLRFDHIVFDEFHTIEARGMGLCVALARAATQIPDGPKVTFLSATPMEIAPTLTACDIPPSDIRIASETVITTDRATPGTRALHGDVRLCLVDAASPAQALQMRLPQARDCVGRGRKLVLVYDSLATLKGEMATLDILLRQIGVGAEQRLLINSFDDSRSVAQDRYAAAGGDRDPADFAVLIATSSVEMGVTFDAGMMVMDPGRSPASFVQRIGWVARGDEAGHVVVALPQGAMDREPWLRGVLNGLRGLGARFDIERFLDACLAGPCAAFRLSPRGRGRGLRTGSSRRAKRFVAVHSATARGAALSVPIRDKEVDALRKRLDLHPELSVPKRDTDELPSKGAHRPKSTAIPMRECGPCATTPTGRRRPAGGHQDRAATRGRYWAFKHRTGDFRSLRIHRDSRGDRLDAAAAKSALRRPFLALRARRRGRAGVAVLHPSPGTELRPFRRTGWTPTGLSPDNFPPMRAERRSLELPLWRR